MMPPHPGPHMPALPFPPVNMMPAGPIPVPPIMNFGMPSLAPLVPPPTLLVPYPVIVPLPVPIPIPVPIPFSPKASGDRPGNDGTLPNAAGERRDSRAPPSVSPGSSRGDGRDFQQAPPTSDTLSPGFSKQTEQSRTNMVDVTVKMENNGNVSSGHSHKDTPADGVIDLTTNRRSRQQLVIQRAVTCVQVKAEPGISPPPLQLGEAEVDGTAGTSTSKTEENHIDSNAKSPLASVALPCADPSYCNGTPPLSQPITCSTKIVPSDITAAKTEPGSATPCNVIVNGSSSVPSAEGSIRTPPLDHRPLVEPCRKTAVACDEPAAADLEGEDLKENSCLATEKDSAGKRCLNDQSAITTGTGEDKPQSPEDVPSGEDHAYALPLMPKPGCVIQPVPKPADKTTAILPCGLTAPLTGTVAMEMEPPLKRRCLRIRNQNK